MRNDYKKNLQRDLENPIKENNMKKGILVVCLIIGTLNCSLFKDPFGYKNFNNLIADENKGGVFHYDASRRGVYFFKAKKFLKICGEPIPDVAYNSSFANETKTKNLETNTDAKREVVELKGRGETVVFLREAMYRLCEMNINYSTFDTEGNVLNLGLSQEQYMNSLYKILLTSIMLEKPEAIREPFFLELFFKQEKVSDKENLKQLSEILVNLNRILEKKNSANGDSEVEKEIKALVGVLGVYTKNLEQQYSLKVDSNVVEDLKSKFNNIQSEIKKLHDSINNQKKELKPNIQIHDHKGCCGSSSYNFKIDCRDNKDKSNTEWCNKSFFFETNSYSINYNDANSIKELATSFLENTKRKILIIGYADKRKNSGENHNNNLSCDRAEVIKQEFLKNSKIKNESIITLGTGYNMPITSNDSRNGEEFNRRVDVNLISDTSNFTNSDSSITDCSKKKSKKN
jgi:outer membrane protein OmpA-like peptidoglycan-associated protein